MMHPHDAAQEQEPSSPVLSVSTSMREVRSTPFRPGTASAGTTSASRIAVRNTSNDADENKSSGTADSGSVWRNLLQEAEKHTRPLESMVDKPDVTATEPSPVVSRRRLRSKATTPFRELLRNECAFDEEPLLDLPALDQQDNGDQGGFLEQVLTTETVTRRPKRQGRSRKPRQSII